MAEPSEQDKHAARLKAAKRRSQGLEQDRSRLHDLLLETAESVRRSHLQTAETLANLADTGPAEYATRRRRAAERSRGFAEEEARQLAALREGHSRKRNRGRDTDDRRDTGPA